MRALTLLASLLCTIPASAETDPLAQSADLRLLLERAVEHNPELRSARARIQAAEASARVAGRLPDLALRYQLWNAPLDRPWDAEMHMLGLEQTLPAFGSRDARERAGLAEARMATHAERSRALEIAAQVRKAHAELARTDAERKLREEHLALVQQIAEVARVQYATGRVSQLDVLRTGVEAARLRADFAALTQARASAAALLNALTGRPADAPLGPAAAEPLPPSLPDLASLDARAEQRPDLGAAHGAIARSEALLEAAEKESRWPMLMLGTDYMFSPMSDHMQHSWSGMITITLPWLNPAHSEAVTAAERSLAADRLARDAAQATARFQLRDAHARARAALEVFTLVDTDLVTQARQGFEAAQAAFAAGQGEVLGLLDSQRSYLQARVDRERARAALLTALADLARASGQPLEP